VTGYCAANVIKIRFDEKLNPNEKNDPFNYTIYRAGYPIDLGGAQLDEFQRAVWLFPNPVNPAGLLSCGDAFDIVAFNLADVSGNQFPEQTLSFQCTPCSDPLPGLCPPIRLNCERLGPYVSLSWNSTNYVLESISLKGPWQLAAPTSPLVL